MKYYTTPNNEDPIEDDEDELVEGDPVSPDEVDDDDEDEDEDEEEDF